MNLGKKDLITIIVLSVVFFSIATYNLGMTQTPTSTVNFSDGDEVYIDIGHEASIKSLNVLLKTQKYNITISSGSPENWQVISSNQTFEDYYKWKEIIIQQNSQFIKLTFHVSEADQRNNVPQEIAEIALINTENELIPIVSISSNKLDDSQLHKLIDEQSEIEYPPTYMSQTYFDEIYFVRTAEQYLHLQWPYEWTHPPLGKLIQAAGIVVFGYSPFGWRIVGVIFATLMIPIIYIIGKKLFNTWIGAFASAFLLTFEFMHFTMGRMGTADTYVVFFSLLSQLFFLGYLLNVVKDGWKTSVLPLFLGVVFFALGFSTKWIVMYGFVGILFLLAVLRLKDVVKLKASISQKYVAFFDHPFFLLLGFILIAVGIYFLTYIPDMIIGRSFFGTNGVIDLQFNMFGYHSGLVATHDFASPWWSWPILVRPNGYVPLWLSVSNLPQNIKSTIVVLGNPAIWWIGFISVLGLAVKVLGREDFLSKIRQKLKRKEAPNSGIANNELENSVVPEEIIENSKDESQVDPENKETDSLIQEQKETSKPRDWAAIFIATLFLFQWIPYVFISRVTFIYHFYISVPFLCLSSAYFINKYWGTKTGKIATIIFFVAVVALFVLFYPVTSGIPSTTDYIDSLKWFPSWYF